MLTEAAISGKVGYLEASRRTSSWVDSSRRAPGLNAYEKLDMLVDEGVSYATDDAVDAGAAGPRGSRRGDRGEIGGAISDAPSSSTARSKSLRKQPRARLCAQGCWLGMRFPLAAVSVLLPSGRRLALRLPEGHDPARRVGTSGTEKAASDRRAALGAVEAGELRLAGQATPGSIPVSSFSIWPLADFHALRSLAESSGRRRRGPP